jgi:hypothetical protein
VVTSSYELKGYYSMSITFSIIGSGEMHPIKPYYYISALLLYRMRQITKVSLASIAVALAMFVLAGLWNLLIFPRLRISFVPGFLRSDPFFSFIVIGYFILGVLIVYIGLRSKFSSGQLPHWIITGILVMEIAFGISSIVLQANYNFPLAALPYDLLWYLIEGTGGGFVAWLFFRS